MKNNGIVEEERFQARVAWMYHIEGMTQKAIADFLGVTRLRVNRALGEAVRNGIIRVHINSPYSPCMNLEAEFTKKYGLKDAFIIPQPSDEANVQVVIGAELGRYLSKLLRNPEIKLFGIAWGSTLNHATRSIIPTVREDLEIVSVMGGLPKGSVLNSFEITTRMAELFKSKRTYLTAPLYASTEQSRDTIMVQEVFQEVLNKVRTADAITMGAGDTSERSLLIQEGLPKDVSPESLIAAGAVGDLLGYFFTKDGHLIDHSLSRRVIGMNPYELRSMPNVILAAGGQHKIPILSTVLKMGIFDFFVTDERTAEGIARYDIE